MLELAHAYPAGHGLHATAPAPAYEPALQATGAAVGSAHADPAGQICGPGGSREGSGGVRACTSSSRHPRTFPSLPPTRPHNQRLQATSWHRHSPCSSSTRRSRTSPPRSSSATRRSSAPACPRALPCTARPRQPSTSWQRTQGTPRRRRGCTGRQDTRRRPSGSRGRGRSCRPGTLWGRGWASGTGREARRGEGTPWGGRDPDTRPGRSLKLLWRLTA